MYQGCSTTSLMGGFGPLTSRVVEIKLLALDPRCE